MGGSTRKIRVLLIGPSLNIVGGQAVQAARLVSALGKDLSIHIDFQPIDTRLPEPFAALQRVKLLRTVVNSLVYIAIMLVRVPRYDILHMFTAAYTSYMLWALPALFIARLYGKRIVLNYRDGQAEDHLRNWRTAAPTIRMMDAVVAPSGFLTDVFARYGLKCEAIWNILDAAPFHYRPRVRPRPAFLHNRSLETLYNVPCTLRAFKTVQERYPAASLTIAHDGPLRGELERYAAELGLRNTKFIGAVPQARIGELYDAADIYLTSPDIDCMPNSLLECFASGLPVVATASGGIPYIATDGETALLAPPGDDQAMARAALRLLEEPGTAERLALNARASCERYAEGPVREQWVALYRKLLHA